MTYETISHADAVSILNALDRRAPLPSEVREKLEVLRQFHLRDLDIIQSYKAGQPNRELCERWAMSQSTMLRRVKHLKTAVDSTPAP